MVLPSGKKNQENWYFRQAGVEVEKQGHERRLVVVGEGKVDHIAISLSVISLTKKKRLEKEKLKRGSLFLRECSKSPYADCQGWRGLSPLDSSGKQHLTELRVRFS